MPVKKISLKYPLRAANFVSSQSPPNLFFCDRHFLLTEMFVSNLSRTELTLTGQFSQMPNASSAWDSLKRTDSRSEESKYDIIIGQILSARSSL